MVQAAIEAAEEGMAGGELPIGAVVAIGPEIIGRAFTQVGLVVAITSNRAVLAQTSSHGLEPLSIRQHVVSRCVARRRLPGTPGHR
jgi:hypothetical protein